MGKNAPEERGIEFHDDDMEQGLLKQSSDDSIRYEGGAHEESQGGEYDQSLVIEVP